jgi:hypothetical protein
MGFVLYCIGNCKRIMVGGSSHDGTQGSGTFICEDCEKKNLANKFHPFFMFANTEKQIRQTGGSWEFRPVEDVLP